MSAAKKKKKTSTSSASSLAKIFAFLLGPFRPVLVVGVLLASLFVGWWMVWRRVGPWVLSSPSHLVASENVDIPPLPKWVHSDIRGEVFRSASLDGPLSIADDDLAERISDAFSLHPWVAKVHRVSKHHPAKVKVELDYRRPVCMVKVPSGLFPVDVHGVLLPVEDFSPVEASHYPQLLGINTVPVGAVGESWGDTRVVGGAEISDLLSSVWRQWGLSHIVPAPSGIRGEYTYTLVTHTGVRIHWGLAPGSNAAGELTAAEKFHRLSRYAEEHGTLDDPKGPKELAVHKL